MTEKYPIIKPRVALVQPHWRDDPKENLDRVLKTIDEIGNSNPVDLICLPEFFMGAPWYFPGRSHVKGLVDDTIPGRITDLISLRAKKYNTYILAGSIIEREGDRYYVTAPLIDNQGKLVGIARKIHRFSAELISIESGRELFLADTPFGKIGVCICADFWIQEMPRMLALKGAEIICVPGASLSQNLEITEPCIQANSSHNVCYTLYASIVGKAVGQRAGRTVTIELGGHSTIAGPERILCGLKGEEAVLFAELDMEYIREMRTVDPSFKRSLYWCLWGRLPHLYGDIKKPYVGATQDLKSLLSAYLR